MERIIDPKYISTDNPYGYEPEVDPNNISNDPEVIPGTIFKQELKNRIEHPIMQYFQYEHLPVDLQVVSKRIHDLAYYMDQSLPDGPEKSAGLRKLLEAKDCFVRSSLR